jgi:hypothetical protein
MLKDNTILNVENQYAPNVNQLQLIVQLEMF